MARIVVVSGSVQSLSRPNAELARRLQLIGHAVTFVSTPDFESTAAAAGLDFIGTAAARRIDPIEPMPEASWAQRLQAVASRRRAVVDTLEDREVADIVAGLDSDLVLVEVELVSQLLAVHSQRLPLASVTIFPHADPGSGVPALHTSAVPGQGREGTDRAIRLRWLRFHVGLRVDLIRQFVRSPGDHRRHQFRRLAKRLGVATNELDFDQWVQPLVVSTIPQISMTPPAFDFSRRARPDRLDIGPMLLDTGEAEEVPAAVSEFVDDARRANRRLIYASYGAFHHGDDSDFMKRLITAVERRPEWSLVVGLGGRTDIEAFGVTASNILLLPWAPQRALLEHADAAVVHGGYSSVHECIQAEVPMLLHPFGIDQPGNAARVVHHGLGILGGRATDTADTIEADLERLLSDASFAASVSDMAARSVLDDNQLIESIDGLIDAGEAVRNA